MSSSGRDANWTNIRRAWDRLQLDDEGFLSLAKTLDAAYKEECPSLAKGNPYYDTAYAQIWHKKRGQR